MHLANALRVKGDLPAAERTAAESEHCWIPREEGSPDPLDDATYYALQASLRRTQGHFAEAIALHDKALSSPGADALRPELLVSKAYTLDEYGDVEGVARTLEEAASCLTGAEDPRLVLALRHNLVDALSKAGNFSEAKELLPEVKRLAAVAGTDLDHARVQWVEGRIAAGLGNSEQGVSLLLKARGVLMSEGIALDAALVTLELASLYLSGGRMGTVKDLARNLATLFQAQALPRETLAALQLFRQAAEAEQVTTDLIDRLLSYLRKARYNPRLKFGEE
jgi:tetratricopeptide (TPR) repeat protein